MPAPACERAGFPALCCLSLAFVASCAHSASDVAAVSSLDAQSARIRKLLRRSRVVPLSGPELCARAVADRPPVGFNPSDGLTLLGLRVRYKNQAALPKGKSLTLAGGRSLTIAARDGSSVLLQVDGSLAYRVAKELMDADGVSGIVPECAIALSSRTDRCEPIQLPVQPEVRPDDPEYARLTGHQLVGYRWDIASRSDGVEVAVFDSGVNCRHPELRDQFWPSRIGEGASPQEDHQDICPRFAGYDYVDMDHDAGHCEAVGGNCYSHGTTMAGVIAARGNNGMGAVGVAPTARVRSYRILASDNAVGPIANFERAILDAHQSGTRIFSISVYGEDSLKDVCDELVRVSTGKGAALVNVLGGIDGTYFRGCAQFAQHPLIVAGVWWYSQTSTVKMHNDTDGAHLYAPAQFVWDKEPNGQAVVDGSSNAVAYVSGAAAQLWGTRAFATCDAQQMRALLLGTAKDVTECRAGRQIKLLNLEFLPAVADRTFASCDDAIAEARKHKR